MELCSSLETLFNQTKTSEKYLIRQSKPTKVMLFELASHLHKSGLIDNIHILERMRNAQIAQHLTGALAKTDKQWILFLDDFDPTPTQIGILQDMMEHCQIIATASKINQPAKTFFMSFSQYDLKPLTDQAIT